MQFAGLPICRFPEISVPAFCRFVGNFQFQQFADLPGIFNSGNLPICRKYSIRQFADLQKILNSGNLREQKCTFKFEIFEKFAQNFEFSRKCPIKWFHFECVGLLAAPLDEWYCTDCNPFH
nr:hypothetical protein F48A11.6 - Caenorhabditis elegans [Caenorhabditis elegans]